MPLSCLCVGAPIYAPLFGTGACEHAVVSALHMCGMVEFCCVWGWGGVGGIGWDRDGDGMGMGWGWDWVGWDGMG